MRAVIKKRTACFTKADLKRALLGVQEMGHTVHAVEFPPDGGFKMILMAEPEAVEVNEWDVALGLTDANGRSLPQNRGE